MNNYLPTLSSRAWSIDPLEKMDSLFAHFMASDHSQTYLYGDTVSSLPYLVQQYGNKPTEFIDNLKTTLSTYYGLYFDAVDVTAYIENKDSYESTYTVVVDLEALHGEKTYKLGRVLELQKGVLNKVIKENNQGS